MLGRVLAVDDDPLIATLLPALLEAAGFRCEVYTTAADAAAAFARAPDAYTLLLTDVRMWPESGPALARRLVAIRTDLPVVYMTGNVSDLRADDRLGASLLHKPFGIDQLRDTLLAALASR